MSRDHITIKQFNDAAIAAAAAAASFMHTDGRIASTKCSAIGLEPATYNTDQITISTFCRKNVHCDAVSSRSILLTLLTVYSIVLYMPVHVRVTCPTSPPWLSVYLWQLFQDPRQNLA